MDLTIKAHVRSSWAVIVLPTLVFLSAWLTLPLGVFLLARSESCLAYAVAVGLGLPLAGGVAVGFHRHFLTGAQGSEALLFLKQDRFVWRRHALDLNGPFRAVVRAEAEALSLELRAGKRSLHLFARVAAPGRIPQVFPEEGFLLPGALGPDQGAPAWLIQEEDALQILAVLWRQRALNTLFQTYTRFPWERPLGKTAQAEQDLPFDSPVVQAEIARAICTPKPKELWLTPEALVFKDGHQASLLPLGRHRLEPLDMPDSLLKWFTFGERTFWLDPGDEYAELEFLTRYVNRR